MNYPLWDLQASGLLIAFVAIVHVFVSHFAVGGGLFLVVTERKARRENDEHLLDYLKKHSRFFALLTLVFGAITGVGIWFTIGLVHPAATSALINAFVWGWAIEWTFFLTEIAAAIVYYYGWDRLSPDKHMTVGWIYFAAAWLSLVIINGILSFMLTPGDWLTTHAFWDGFFNPTYWSSLVIRTLGAMGLAGVYALFTASWIGSPESERKLTRYAIIGWIVPMAVGVPLALIWYFSAAAGAGVPLGEIFGAGGNSIGAIVSSAFANPTTGYPVAHMALRVAIIAMSATIVLALALLAIRGDATRRVLTALMMIAAFLSIGGAEWVREDLRKPYVIGSYMFVNGIRVPPPDGSPAAAKMPPDSFEIGAIDKTGVLANNPWVRLPAGATAGTTMSVELEAATGREVFRVLCARCHTIDGYMAIRPLIQGKSASALESVIDQLAVAKTRAGTQAAWSQHDIRLVTWRGRRMPPFAGTEAEHRALAVYLATLGGGTIDAHGTGGATGAKYFEDNCSMCHGAGGDWPIETRVAGRSETEIYDILGNLPARNEMMPAFEGTDEERHALASYLFGIAAKPAGGK